MIYIKKNELEGKKDDKQTEGDKQKLNIRVDSETLGFSSYIKEVQKLSNIQNVPQYLQQFDSSLLILNYRNKT